MFNRKKAAVSGRNMISPSFHLKPPGLSRSFDVLETFQHCVSRNLRHVWEEGSGHQELQTDLCVVVDTRTTGDMSSVVSCVRRDRSHTVIT